MTNMTKLFNMYLVSLGLAMYAAVGLYAVIKQNKTEGEVLSGFEHGKTSYKYNFERA